MIKIVHEKSNHVFQWKEGSIYPILFSMEKKELIKSYWKEDKRRRKYYEITPKGLKEVKKLEHEWRVFSDSMAILLGGAL